MALIKCRECKKTYSDTLEACPHCGYKRPKKVFCATCKNQLFGYKEEELPKKLCVYCGFPVLEDHSVERVSSNELTEQNMLVEKEKAEVERILQEWRERLEQYRDGTIKKWRAELEERISAIESNLSYKKTELASLGPLSFGRKKELKKEINQLQEQIQEEKEKLSQIESAEQRMTKKIVRETTDESKLSDSFYSHLCGYIKGFIRRVQKNNSDYNASRELAKDRMLQLLAENGKPMAENDVVDRVIKQYPEYSFSKGGLFVDLLKELHEEAQISMERGLVMRNNLLGVLKETLEPFYYCNSNTFCRPVIPDLESLFITNTEKELVVKQVQKEKGEQYTNYIEGIAEKYGFGPIRKNQIKSMNSAIQSEIISSMQVIVNSGAAAANSKKSSPAIVGGAVNALAGPIVGVAAAYTTALQNRAKDARRKQAELQRDIYLAQNAQDLSVAERSVQQVDLLDYKLLQMEYGSAGNSM